jgi:hypothetical protein
MGTKIIEERGKGRGKDGEKSEIINRRIKEDGK